jgi:hypothetical protein
VKHVADREANGYNKIMYFTPNFNFFLSPITPPPSLSFSEQDNMKAVKLMMVEELKKNGVFLFFRGL